MSSPSRSGAPPGTSSPSPQVAAPMLRSLKDVPRGSSRPSAFAPKDRLMRRRMLILQGLKNTFTEVMMLEGTEVHNGTEKEVG